MLAYGRAIGHMLSKPSLTLRQVARSRWYAGGSRLLAMACRASRGRLAKLGNMLGNMLGDSLGNGLGNGLDNRSIYLLPGAKVLGFSTAEKVDVTS